MTTYPISATLGFPTDDRPPIGAVPPPGVAEPYLRLRRTVFDRRRFVPEVWDLPGDYPAPHPYVRRYWTAVLGPGAVADLLRLATAAARGRSLPRPVHLVELARAGLVKETGSAVLVRTSIPAVPASLRRRLPPVLQRELSDLPTCPPASVSSGITTLDGIGGPMTSYHDRVAAAKAEITEIPPAEARRRVEAGAVLLDVREQHEIDQASLAGSLNLPMGTVLDQIGSAVPDRGTEVIVFCAVGARSALVAQAMTGLGYRAVSSVEGGLQRWVDDGFPLQRPSVLDPEQRHRYHRHLVLAEVGEQGQRRLLDSSVAVVGAGGLGSPVAMYLAAAGVGSITLIDDDEVDLTNLQRQIIHTDDRVGEPKVESAAKTLHHLNPEVSVEARAVRLDASNVLDLIDGADVIVDCGDNFPTRYLLNDASMHTAAPVVHGSVLRFEGQVSVFAPYRGPCYRCLYPLPPPPELAQSCAQAGVLGVLPGVVGTLQATEALKLLLGIGDPLVGRLLVYDALDQTMRTFTVTRSPDCPACSERSAPPPLVDYDDACRPVGVGAAG